MIVPRTLQKKVSALARTFPVVTIVGPRQSGKTTLCRACFPRKPYVSLEALDLREYARTDPRGFLAEHREGAILDEIQRVPELLSYLQGEVDERQTPGRFILTGSANLQVLRSVSQSLAGRAAVVTLLPLDLEEAGRFPRAPKTLFETLFQGGYPAIYDRGLPPRDWYAGYVASYVERDVREILNVGDLVAFQTFLRMCAARSGQLLNLSGLGADCGITHNTARAWLSVLEASYIAIRIPPLLPNLGTRLVKSPKLHFLDSGVLSYLLGIESPSQLRHHPLRGAIFESWVVSQVLKARLHRGVAPNLFYFRDRKGLEVDLVVDRGDSIVALEAKSGETAAQEFFVPLRRFAQALSARPGARGIRRVLVYGGDSAQRRTGESLIPWADLARYKWAG